MQGGSVTAQPLAAVPRFNWVFLVELIVCGILTLFFLFYFNRLFATLVSYGIRAYTWHYYHVYIDIHALQISFLGGRIFFKGLRYHGENETILVQSGYITWRYWLRTVRKPDLYREERCAPNGVRSPPDGSDGEKSTPSPRRGHEERGGIKETSSLPCRIEVTLQGLEWFVYNRSAVYESILSGFGHSKNNHDEGTEQDTAAQSFNIKTDKISTDEGQSSSRTRPRSASLQQSEQSAPDPSNATTISFDDENDDTPISKILSLLPVWVTCNKGAMVVGNENTNCILTTKFDNAAGQIDASSSGSLDIYRQTFDFTLEHPIVQMRPNPDFKQSQLSAGSGLSSKKDEKGTHTKKKHRHWRHRQHRRKIWHSVGDLIPYFQKSVESFRIGPQSDKRRPSFGSQIRELPGGSRWLGLTRYLDEDDRDEHEGWDAVEYARFSTIVDCPSLCLSYYWDIPGKVPSTQLDLGQSMNLDDINGMDPPEWGMHLSVRGGSINYGPWADRERANLQAVLFPNSYQTAQQAKPLAPNSLRQSTVFKLTIDIEKETTLRIPTREPSKDWQFKGRADAVRGRASKLHKPEGKKNPRSKEPEKSGHGPDIRPFGWLSLRIDANSSITYKMDMVSLTPQYRNRLDLDLRETRMTSSVNHGLLWQSTRQTVSCDLSNPLEWKNLHTWTFDVDSRDLQLFLLRDHIFLLTDLVNDWTSGPSSEFYTFLPYHYRINLTFTNFRLFMNVNDSNIINNPSDINDNAFLVIKGQKLSSNVSINTSKYSPSRNSVPFDVDVSNATMELSTPLWNTQHTFLRDQSVASLKNLHLDGSYNYNIATSSTLTDTFILNILGSSPKLYLYGFLIRYFILIKENYFGENMHFKTLEEYQAMLAAHTGQDSVSLNHASKSNDLDVFIHVHGDNPTVLLPVNMYEHKESLKLDAIGLDADVRFTNYYMDLEAAFTPLEAFIESIQQDGTSSVSNSQLFIDGLSVYGHRLFGLPPIEPTYVCNWDFDVGSVIGECSTDFLRSAMASLRFVGFSIDDEENALPLPHPTVLHDVTLVRARVNSIRVWTLLDEAALLVGSGILNLDFNDLAGNTFSERLNLSLLDLALAVVDRKSAARMREKSRQPVTTYAYFNTNVSLKMVERKPNFAADRALQQQHVRIHDRRSNRTPWLLRDSANNSAANMTGRNAEPPSMPLPPMPEPIRFEDDINARFSDVSSLIFSYSSSTNSSDPSLQSVRSVYKEKSLERSSGATRSASGGRFLGSSGPPTEKVDILGSKPVRQTSPPLRRAEFAHRQVKGFDTGQSGRWTRPYYQLQNVELDVKDVPSLPHMNNDYGHEVVNHDGDVEYAFGSDNENVTRVNFICTLGSGLKGFCSPEALYAISSLVDGLQPTYPLNVLDDLQASVIGDILKREKFKPNFRRVISVSLRLPASHIRLISSSMDVMDDSFGSFRDQYDLALSRVNATFRTADKKKDNGDIHPTELGSTMHVIAERISVSAKGEKVDAVGQKGLFNAELDDIVFWLVAGDIFRSRLRIQNIEGVTSSKSVEDVASLIQRTTKLVDSVWVPLKEASASKTRRLRSLVHFLTTNGAQIQDPLFLTRPSYVLRTASEHLRLSDSWKIICHLRNIYKCLPGELRSQLDTACLENTTQLPPDAQTTVLSSFDKWRSWDLAHVEKSNVMKHVWALLDGETKLLDSKTKGFSVFINRTKLSLDPGPKESDVLIEDLSTSLLMSVDREGTTAKEARDSAEIKTFCSNAAIKLKWEVCELIEGLFKNVADQKERSNGASQISRKKESAGVSRDVHFAFAMDRSSVALSGINVNVFVAGDGMKGSFVHQPSSKEALDQTCVVLSADAGSTELFGRSNALMVWNILRPNVFFSHSSQARGSRLQHDWKLSAGCQKLQYDMKEDPLGIIQVADRLVQDEVRYILGLVSTGHTSQPAGETQPSEGDIHNFYLATFLEDYQLWFTLLPSLAYVISGDVARLSVSPAPGSKLGVDFDIKNNSHTFRSRGRDKAQVISTLGIPPINGRVVVNLSSTRAVLDVDTTIELIKVDAGAVRNLLGTVNGPEISHLLSDANHNARTFKQNLDHILSRLPRSPEIKAYDNNREFVYKVRLTLAGIGIHSDAPSLRGQDHSADMNLNFGMIQVNLENAKPNGPVLEYPEFNAHLREIGFALQKCSATEMHPSGDLTLNAQIRGTSKVDAKGDVIRSYHLAVSGLQLNLFAETAAMMIDIAAHLQERLKALELTHEIKHLRKLRLITSTEVPTPRIPSIEADDQTNTNSLFNAMYSIELSEFHLRWIVSEPLPATSGRDPDDLVFSIEKIELATRKDNAARLRIGNTQLQMISSDEDKQLRSHNSALLPEVVFNVAYYSATNGHRLAFQAAGKALDIRMTSDFIIPASFLQQSMASASEQAREANIIWKERKENVPPAQNKKAPSSNNFRLASLLVDADFAGAVFSLQGRQEDEPVSAISPVSKRSQGGGKYGQYIQADPNTTATLRAPGVALKVQFEDIGVEEPTLNAEIKVDASTNVLYPTVVPLISQVSSSIKEVVGDADTGDKPKEGDRSPQTRASQPKLIGDDDAKSILGRCKLNAGLRICKQEFTLSCQPIARVAATASFADSYMTVNTVESAEQRRFFAILVGFNSLQASVKHVYSSESTASFAVDSIAMSLMNSKHVSSSSGISAILKVSPMNVQINAKQVQDFLLFREIWVPPDDSPAPPQPTRTASSETQDYIVQRYQQMASAGAFPWNSIIAIAKLDIQVDLGQTLGKVDFTLADLWLSSKKTSDFEQNLCIGLDTITIESKGRLAGLVELRRFKVRTSIKWPNDKASPGQTPLIQASVGFNQLQSKVAFEYQPFLVADITSFDFLMYNVRSQSMSNKDRLVSILEGDKFQVFCTSITASLGLALYQTLQRLAQDRQAAYTASLKEIERFLQRKSIALMDDVMRPSPEDAGKDDNQGLKMPISLHTDVVVNLRAVNIGAFPSTFNDNQIFKLEALDAEARFSVSPQEGRIHSGLGLTFGQLRVALSAINKPEVPPTEEFAVDDVVLRATGSRGGTILKVPRVVASMETWQSPESNHIDYIFQSSFEGKVDVGWNYSRISFIRGMWSHHSRALASRLGKPLPQSAVQITREREGESGEYHGQEKITAVVNVPQSRYSYTAMVPPVIETPQLRDMGDATPPLEWIGLHRDKLPNVTHQIIIVTLMEIAKDVEDAYSKILGSS